MKKSVVIFVVLFSLFSFSAFAQGGGNFQRRTVEERVKDVMEKLAPLSLDKEKLAETDSVFTHYYRNIDKSMEEVRASGSFDRETMMAKRKELSDARDEKLKKLWTADQFKKFKDEIEPSLRPQRPNRD